MGGTRLSQVHVDINEAYRNRTEVKNYNTDTEKLVISDKIRSYFIHEGMCDRREVLKGTR